MLFAIARAGNGVADIAVIVDKTRRKPEGSTIANWYIDHALQAQALAIAIFAANGRFHVPDFWLCGDEMNQACRSVLAKKRSLRPLENFDTLEVKKVAARDKTLTRTIDTVNHCANRRLKAQIENARSQTTD